MIDPKSQSLFKKPQRLQEALAGDVPGPPRARECWFFLLLVLLECDLLLNCVC